MFFKMMLRSQHHIKRCWIARFFLRSFIEKHRSCDHMTCMLGDFFFLERLGELFDICRDYIPAPLAWTWCISPLKQVTWSHKPYFFWIHKLHDPNEGAAEREAQKVGAEKPCACMIAGETALELKPRRVMLGLLFHDWARVGEEALDCARPAPTPTHQDQQLDRAEFFSI